MYKLVFIAVDPAVAAKIQQSAPPPPQYTTDLVPHSALDHRATLIH